MKKPQQIELDRFEICLSGLGGQGVLTLGKILGQALALGHGYYVTQTQSYGPEARGGASRSDLVVSSSPISYPKTDKIDLLVALSQEACNRYFGLLKPGGALLVNTSLVKQIPTNRYLGLPFSDLAQDRLGLPQAMNTVVLGAMTFLLPFARRPVIKKSLEETLPPKIRAVNVKALNLGHREAEKHFTDLPEWGGEESED
jgi:2-oxoglutarate ferredoxin oxidoreductase subunit gamma